MKKKGVSPVIATVLLVAIVVVLILIIFIWARGIIGEVVQKQDKSIEQVCDEVVLEARYLEAQRQINIINQGNVPVYNLHLRKKYGASIDFENIGVGVSLGESKAIDIEDVVGGYDEIEVYPVLLGETETGKKMYTCKNKMFIAYT